MTFAIERIESPQNLDVELAASLESWVLHWWEPARQPYWWWVATDEETGKWAGYSGLTVHGPEAVYTGPVFVKEKYRGYGLQRAMHGPKEQFARDKGYKSIVSCTEYANIHSSNNLIASGFRLTLPWCNYQALYWEKKLS